MVVEKVRGTGAAKAIHDELLDGRPEQRVTLLVEHDHPGVLIDEPVLKCLSCLGRSKSRMASRLVV